MFGRDLAEQVHADAKNGNRQVPVIVEKCINAVEASGMSDGACSLPTPLTEYFQPWIMKESIASLVDPVIPR